MEFHKENLVHLIIIVIEEMSMHMRCRLFLHTKHLLHNEVLSDFENIGAEVLRTDRNGDITYYIDNGKITAKTEK